MQCSNFPNVTEKTHSVGCRIQFQLFPIRIDPLSAFHILICFRSGGEFAIYDKYTLYFWLLCCPVNFPRLPGVAVRASSAATAFPATTT